MYWGFLELCNRLQKIGGPQIFNAELKRKITGYIFSEVTLDGNSEKTCQGYYEPNTEEMIRCVQNLTRHPQPPVDTSTLPAHSKAYLSKALYEINSELHLYYKWVNNGNESIPSMIIPSFPLDSSVDVPFDVFY